MAEVDALILLPAVSTPRAFRGTTGSRWSLASASATTTSTSRARTANDVALAITPDGVRRPVAVAIVTLILALAGNLVFKDRLTGGQRAARRGA